MARRSYLIKEKFYKRLFLFQDNLKIAANDLYNFLNTIFILSTLIFGGLFIYQIGFRLSNILPYDYYKFYKIIFLLLFVSKYLQQIIKFEKKKLIGWLYEGVLFIISFILLLSLTFNGVDKNVENVGLSRFLHLLIVIILLIVSEVHKLMRIINSMKISPLLLFAFSFLLIIFIGSGLLMLPSAHTIPITYLDALFTSTSAVCVTGLVVVNTATTFTLLGKIIIICLIQIGGLGIMAFTGFFSFAFTGSVSFRDRLMLKEIVSSETLGGIFRLITKILLITFLFEGFGALIIYFNVSDLVGNRVLFAIFHSISAFCNAGFSTLSAGLGSSEIQKNYWVIITIAMLIIFGGIGFPVLIMLYANWKQRFIRVINKSKRKYFSAKIISRDIGNNLAVETTIILIISGTILYYIFENKTGMQGLSIVNKFIEAFFGSVSARTAGFNIVDITRWSYPTVFIIIFLMWIGASPGSTGGGIKTTTFAVALHAVLDFVRGRSKIEIKYRKIGNETITRVLILIVLSIIVIFTGFMGLIITNSQKNPVYLLFESVSAFATVGLSITDTATISRAGQLILICLMYIGRVGPLAFLMGIFVSNKYSYSRYPEKDLTIN